MARPTRDTVLTGEFSLDGSPWVNVAASPTPDLDTLEYSVNGNPWYGVEQSGYGPLTALKFDSVLITNTGAISGVSPAFVTKFNGIST